MGRWSVITAILVMGLMIWGVTGCGGAAAPKMEWGGKGFFSFPWPNDLRRNVDGTVNLEGFPGTENTLLDSVLAKGVPYMKGFGTNAGVVFQFNRALDPDSLPDARQTLEDDSALMLVNIDPEHPAYLQRIPIRSNFDPVTTLYQPGHLLTMMPVAGYALEPDTQYAAIVFDDLKSLSGENIAASSLVNALRSGMRPGTLQEENWQQLESQWQRVAQYTSDHTARTSNQISAFTVYRTMDPTRFAFPVAQAIAQLSDQEIIDSVHVTQAGPMCGYYNHLSITADIDLPVWQQGVRPYSLAGGMISIDADSGLAVQQGVEATDMAVHLGCSGGAKPKIPMIFADGTGASFRSAGNITGGVYDGDVFDHVALSVGPHQTGYRAAPILRSFRNWLAEFGIDLPATAIEGITYYNLLNPAANIGNHIQSAADQLYLRRVALLLPQILARADLDQDELNFNFSDFNVRDDTAVLAGHSQGAGIVPLAMAMDPVFDNGYLSGAGSHAYFQATHRGSIRSLIPVLLPGFVQSEVDYFHPLMQVLQMMHEPADSVNYVPYMESVNMVQVAGYRDGCVPREASAALGLALARKGLIQPAEPLSREASFFDPDGILDLPVVSFPLALPNLGNGGIGLFLELGTGHYPYRINQTLHHIMLRITGAVPDQEISAPHFSRSGTGCDVRMEQGYSPAP